MTEFINWSKGPDKQTGAAYDIFQGGGMIELFCQNILLPGEKFPPPWKFLHGIWPFLCQN